MTDQEHTCKYQIMVALLELAVDSQDMLANKQKSLIGTLLRAVDTCAAVLAHAVSEKDTDPEQAWKAINVAREALEAVSQQGEKPDLKRYLRGDE